MEWTCRRMVYSYIREIWGIIPCNRINTMLIKSFVLSYHVALRSEYSVVMSVTIAAWKRCSDCLTPSWLKECSCLIYVICNCLKTVVSNTYCVVFCFRLVYPMLPVSLDCPLPFGFLLPVSLDCPFLIAPSVFSKVYVRQFSFTLKERVRLQARNIQWMANVRARSVLYSAHTYSCYIGTYFYTSWFTERSTEKEDLMLRYWPSLFKLSFDYCFMFIKRQNLQ